MERATAGTRTTRRRFLRDTGAAGAVALCGPTRATAFRRPRRRPQAVAVFGGGVAGLTAAHELAERGLDVTVYERREWGGKARSTIVAGTGTGGRDPLPGEHAYRAEFGVYQNVPDLMKRIPWGANPNGVFDNMVEVRQVTFSRTEKSDVTIPLTLRPQPRDYGPETVLDTLHGLLVQLELPPDAVAFFLQRLAIFGSSCDARRLGEIEPMTWFEFIGADRFSEDYVRIIGKTMEFVQGVKAEDSGAKFPAEVFLIWVGYGILGRGTNGAALRMLNRPTSEAWITPWVEELRRRGVHMRLGAKVTGLRLRGGRIAAANVRTARRSGHIHADHYVVALPIEFARKLWNPAVLRADPTLAQMHRFRTEWYQGVQFYLRERPEIVSGIGAAADAPWSGTYVPQQHLWSDQIAKRYGDGSVVEKLSTIVSSWHEPGVLYGKPAVDCTPEELVREQWEQLKQTTNEPGRPAKLRDDMLHSSYIDPGLIVRGNRFVGNHDTLVVPTAGTERYRPSPRTAIPNLALCGDYLDGSWAVASMETACFNGRRAANVVLDQAGSTEPPAPTPGLYEPPEWEPLRRLDEDRWRRGEPNLLDGPELSLAQLKVAIGRLLR